MLCALGGTRTPNLLVRSQMLYPLSYERSRTRHSVRHRGLAPRTATLHSDNTSDKIHL